LASKGAKTDKKKKENSNLHKATVRGTQRARKYPDRKHDAEQQKKRLARAGQRSQREAVQEDRGKNRVWSANVEGLEKGGERERAEKVYGGEP